MRADCLKFASELRYITQNVPIPLKHARIHFSRTISPICHPLSSSLKSVVMFLLINAILLALLVTAGTASPVAQGSDENLEPAPPGVKLRKVTWNGSGCPVGGGTVCAISSDSQVVTMIYNQAFTAAVGDGLTVLDSRKDCQLNFDIDYVSWHFNQLS
jgi:hypothetical protein